MSATTTTSTASRALFRRGLRVVAQFPAPTLRPKLAYNVRHAFELYRDVTDPAHLQRLHTMATHDFAVIGALGRELTPTELGKVFKGHSISSLAKPKD